MFKHSWLRSLIIKLTVFFVITPISNGVREERFLGATQITREQINQNFQASGSIAIGQYSATSVWFGFILAKDTFVSSYFHGVYKNIYVSELTVPYESAGTLIKDSDGEMYAGTAPTQQYGPAVSLLRTSKFEPLPEDSKAVVATLPPNGSKPPPPGTEGCIAYGFNEKDQTDGSDPTVYRLGYLPLIIKPFQKCKDRMPASATDENLQFCGALKSKIQPFCSPIGRTFDFPMTVACPPGTLRREYEKEGKFIEERQEGKQLCLWWWCQEAEDPVVKQPWIIVGISSYMNADTPCNTANNDALFIFSFMGNLPSV